jgi:argininosuccinate synthase
MIDKSQENVEGKVNLKLYKGNVIITGRQSDKSLYNSELATFESDNIYSQKDAEGFIKLNALRLRQKKITIRPDGLLHPQCFSASMQ